MRAASGFALAALVGAALASPAQGQVAEAHAIRGRILVNAGEGYRPIAGTLQLKPGDVAIAAPQALGRLIYADGCSVDIVPGSVIWVRSRSPCAESRGSPLPQDPDPKLVPRKVFDPAWLARGAASIDVRKRAAGP